MMRIAFILLSFVGCVDLGVAKSQSSVETAAKQAILIDYNTGEVLFNKNGDELMVPSSMTKIMTVYILMQKLADKKLKLSDEFIVSEKAWRLQGSKMFVDLGSNVRLEDLLRGIIVQSGNDACVVVAEGTSGSEEAFARHMTKVARQLGATHTTFLNASGWPEDGHRTTARDLALIAMATIRDFPQYYNMYSELEFTYNGIRQGNRNVLLGMRGGVKIDGLKTGHTEDGGYGIVLSGVQNGRRLILVCNGYRSMAERAKDAGLLMAWAFRETGLVRVFPAGHVIAKTGVWHGQKNEVELTTPKAVEFVLSRRDTPDLKVRVVHPNWIVAPVKAGQVVGKVIVQVPGEETVREFPFVVKTDVERAGFFGRFISTLGYMVMGR
jgi:D-alanyl-D-alanine carboxypeptidase (penicillin-binding protein 5/6)